jgi:hypothetical protein
LSDLLFHFTFAGNEIGMTTKSAHSRTILLFLFIVSVFYCYGAGMMDYFGVYESWKEVGEKEFAAVHGFQGSRIINIFVLPSAVMTLLNILIVLFPPANINKKLLWWALIAYAFDWIFSFTMQIPIQIELGQGKNVALIDELLRTNWWRFAADTIQFVIVCVVFWKILARLQNTGAVQSLRSKV